MIQTISDLFATVQGWLFETLVQPLVFFIGMGEFVEEAFTGTEFVLVGICELVILFLILRPLESAIPVHPITDPRARWNDFIYTVLQRLGIIPIIAFLLLDPAPSLMLSCCCVALYYLVCYLYCAELLSRHLLAA